MFANFRRWLGWFLSVFLMSLLLAGCSGGSDSGRDSTTMPSIKTQPASVNLPEGASATFTVAADGSAPLSYQWRKNGTNIDGATAATFTLPAVTAADNGAQFTVVVSNAAGSVTSSVATLTTTAPIAPSITTQPAATSVVAPATASFTVAATGTAPLAYQWRRNGVNIGGASDAAYTTPATTPADAGAIYSVIISNAAGQATSDDAVLTVTASIVAPAITTQPVDAMVNAGQIASFSVVATGTAPLAYQWRRNGVSIGGATGASYSTPATADADNGARFSVAVSNAAPTGATSAEVTLTVTPAVIAPAITGQPVSVSVTEGMTATFTVSTTGTSPTYQWRKNGVPIAGATSASYTTPATVGADNGALFSVVVSNAAATVISNNATLTVGASVVAPAITQQPANVTVAAGNTATFSVITTGTAPLAYQWRRAGVNIAGATAATYTTPATLPADSGALYSVVVSNSADTVTSANATLTVNPIVIAPTIASQPASTTVVVGQTATFSVAVNGTSPFGYQWRRNGVDIGGATAANYTTPATVAGDNGAAFSVVVSNSAGPVTSDGAVLTVTLQWSGIRQDGAPFPLQFGTGPNIAYDQARAVATDRQGNVVIAGFTDGTFAASSPQANGAFLAKYSPGGALRWARRVLDQTNGFGATEGAYGVATDPTGNIYVTGETLNALPGEIAAGGLDVFVAKFDASGTRLWAHQFGSSRNDSARGIAVDSSGNAFAVGFSDGQLPLQPPPAGEDFFIVKYDTNGNRLWLQQADLGRSDEAHAIALDSLGNAYVAGATFQQAGTFAGSKAFVAKYNGGGTQQWVTLVGETQFPQVNANAVAASSDGSIVYMSGRTYQDFDLPGQPQVAPNCCVQGDAFVARFNGAGARQWIHNLSSQTLSGPRYFDDEAYGITTNAAGSALFITGYTAGVMPGETSKGNEDMFAARYEADGTRTWVRQLGAGLPATGVRNDRAFGIAMDPNGDLFIAGVTLGTFGTPGRNTDRNDWFVLKMKPADGSLY